MSDTSSPILHEKSRVMAYIDGFNVYYGLRHACRLSDQRHLEQGGHPQDCLGRSLYWLNLEEVVLSKLEPSEACQGVKYFSAPRRVPKKAPPEEVPMYLASNERQRVYLEALRTCELIEVILGWYSEGKPHRCRVCQTSWPNFEEKVTDVNIATHMLADAYEDRFDTALVLSADADLVPPIEVTRRLGKKVVVGLFPGRRLSDNLRQRVDEVREISIKSLRKRRFSDELVRPDLPPLRCPDGWREIGGWVWDSAAPVPYFRRSLTRAPERDDAGG